MMIQTQTFDLKGSEEELAVLSAAIQLLDKKDYLDALKVLVARHDQLTAKPKLKLYDPREAA